MTNPFNDSEDESEDEQIFLDACEICCKSFPSPDFVNLHKKIFHSANFVKTKYVEDADDLIVSFSEEPMKSAPDAGLAAPSASSSKLEINAEVATQNSNTDRTKKSKYILRKRLKY